MKFRTLMLTLTATLSSARSAEAIVVRHDVPDRQYLAQEADFRQVFALYVNRAGHNDCLATLITPSWALTAAHCTKDAPFLQEMAKARPRYKVKIAGRDAFLDRVVRHPLSERRKGGAIREWVDLALVHLQRPVRGIRPVPLHRATEEKSMIILLPGWGTTGTGATGLATPDGRFRVAQNRIDRAEGGWIFWTFDDPAEGKALPLEGVSGPGDSGGPALVRKKMGFEVVGISSFQDTEGQADGTYGVLEGFVRVSQFAPWIDLVTGRPSVRRQTEAR